MTSGNRVQPTVEPAPVRVAAQIMPPAHPVEQKGVNPSPKACVQYARTVPGWPVEPRPQPGFAEELSFPQRIQFDERSVPCSGKNNRWVDAMLGRTGFVTPGHVVESTTGTLIAPAPTEAVSAPLPTFSHIRSPDYPAAYGVTESAREDHSSHVNQPAERVGTSGDDGRCDSRGNDDGPGNGWHKVDSSRPPASAPPPGPPGDPPGGNGGGGSGPPGGPPDDPSGGGGAVEMDRPTSMACFLLICVLHVRRLKMKSCVRDVDETAPAHQPGIACHASTVVVRFVAQIRWGFVEFAWSERQEIPWVVALALTDGKMMVKRVGRTTKRQNVSPSLLKRNLRPINSVLGSLT